MEERLGEEREGEKKKKDERTDIGIKAEKERNQTIFVDWNRKKCGTRQEHHSEEFLNIKKVEKFCHVWRNCPV